jgi:hypothetical protein
MAQTTIREHIDTLPEPYKTQAINNLNNIKSVVVVKHTSVAIAIAFTWENTPQGYDYWNLIYNKYFSNGN